MSEIEMGRLFADCVRNRSLLLRVSAAGGDIGRVVAVARGAGYQVDLSGARAYLAAIGRGR